MSIHWRIRHPFVAVRHRHRNDGLQLNNLILEGIAHVRAFSEDLDLWGQQNSVLWQVLVPIAAVATSGRLGPGRDGKALGFFFEAGHRVAERALSAHRLFEGVAATGPVASAQMICGGSVDSGYSILGCLLLALRKDDVLGYYQFGSFGPTVKWQLHMTSQMQWPCLWSSSRRQQLCSRPAALQVPEADEVVRPFEAITLALDRLPCLFYQMPPGGSVELIVSLADPEVFSIA
mmetsp:Transcript_64091/g.134751  ORF Transcript_64091/g.134751 Transcript_64091/m.134751 type:complete len:233 (+) Transcript_64091:941-1639(+)